MNEVFLIGKVIGKITFKFIINSKNKSVASFNIEMQKNKIQDKQIITLKAYNGLADFAYSRLKENDNIFINGRIEENVVKIEKILKCNENFTKKN